MAQIILYQVERAIGNILSQLRPNGADVFNTVRLDEVTNTLKDPATQVEVLVVGSDVPDPVRVAQQANSLRRNLAVVLLANTKHMENLRRALQFAPLVGSNTFCTAAEDFEGAAEVIAKTVLAATQRVKRQAALNAADLQIGAQPAPTLRRMFMEHILHSAPVGLVATDIAGNVLAWNTFASTLTGINERKALGKHIGDQLTAPWGSKLWNYVTACLSGKTSKSQPLLIELQSRMVEVTCSILQESDINRRVILLLRDITEKWRAQREAEEARRLLLATNEALKKARDQAVAANRAKSTFLATMSHELRTPLNAIIGYSEMLQEQALDEHKNELASDLARINYAGRHLLMLISDILDISKIEAGKMDLFVSRFDLRSIIEEVTSTAEPLLEKNHNRMIVDCSGDLGQVVSDETKVRQILYNLLSNAAKFTENGEIYLSVRREKAAPTDQIHIEIADTGIGMTDDQVSLLFQEFTQIDPSSTRKHGGSGLGLAISKRFLAMMGGSISVRSKSGTGTRFNVTLPATAAGNYDLHTPHIQKDEKIGSTSDGDESVSRTMRDVVLVIDDDPALHQMMRHILGKERFRMESAFDGKTGIKLARDLMPRAIILDVLMPEVDGWTVLTEIKADPKLAEIPVIIVSIVDDKNLGFALGASDYMTKPFERSRLLSILRRYQCDVKRCKVLVMEDDSSIRDLLHRLLTTSGCDVQVAKDGAEGLTALRKEIPDVILLDLMMPEIDGFEVLERLREQADWKTIPVIVTTAKELDDKDRERLRSGVSRVLQKGRYTKDDLLREIESAMLTLDS